MSFSFERSVNRALRKVHQIAEYAGVRAAQRRVVFMHIPKCAGSSIVSAAKSYLGSEKSGNVVLLDDFMPREKRRALIARAKDALFVSGHFGFETLEQVRKDAFVFTLLREPYERLRSVYGYMTTLKDKNPLSEAQKGLSREAFFASKDEAILQWTDNVIARALAQTCDRDQVTIETLDAMVGAAIKNLERFDHVGFVDTLPQDLQRIHQATRITTFATPSHKNSTESHRGKNNRPEAVAPLGEDARKIGFDLIRADMQVYEAALRLRTRQPNGA